MKQTTDVTSKIKKQVKNRNHSLQPVFWGVETIIETSTKFHSKQKQRTHFETQTLSRFHYFRGILLLELRYCRCYNHQRHTISDVQQTSLTAVDNRA